MRVVVDKNKTYNYNSYGVVYENDEVKKVIYSELSFQYEILTRDYIGRPTSTKISRIEPETTLSVTNSVSYQDNFSNKVTNESTSIYDRYSENNTTTVNTTYAYDGINRLTSVGVTTGGINRTTEYSFVPAQELNKIPPSSEIKPFDPNAPDTSFNPIKTIGTTNLIGEITETGYGASTATTQVEYDKNGNITKYGITTYVYDSLNRLVRENNYELDKTIVYEYNNSGQLFKRKEYPYTTSSTISSEPTASTVFSGGNWVDQVATVRNALTNEDKYIEYDDAGRATSFGGLSFTWDENGGSLNSLSFQSQFGTLKTEYLYGDSGDRVSKINYAANSNTESGKVHFRYLNGKLVYQVCDFL